MAVVSSLCYNTQTWAKFSSVVAYLFRKHLNLLVGVITVLQLAACAHVVLVDRTHAVNAVPCTTVCWNRDMWYPDAVYSFCTSRNILLPASGEVPCYHSLSVLLVYLVFWLFYGTSTWTELPSVKDEDAVDSSLSKLIVTNCSSMRNDQKWH